MKRLFLAMAASLAVSASALAADLEFVMAVQCDKMPPMKQTTVVRDAPPEDIVDARKRGERIVDILNRNAGKKGDCRVALNWNTETLDFNDIHFAALNQASREALKWLEENIRAGEKLHAKRNAEKGGGKK